MYEEARCVYLGEIVMYSRIHNYVVSLAYNIKEYCNTVAHVVKRMVKRIL